MDGAPYLRMRDGTLRAGSRVPGPAVQWRPGMPFVLADFSRQDFLKLTTRASGQSRRLLVPDALASQDAVAVA